MKNIVNFISVFLCIILINCSENSKNQSKIIKKTIFKNQKSKLISISFFENDDTTENIKTYINLEKTNFPTLYAATHPADDWAESFASYVHSVLMKKPFNIKIKDTKNPEIYINFKLCWGKPRCANKEVFLAWMLGQ